VVSGALVLGQGLAGPLRGRAVDRAPGGQVQLLREPDELRAALRDHAAALATQAP